MNHLMRRAVIGSGLCIGLGTFAFGGQFVFHDLGLAGGDLSFGEGLNNLGDVAGFARTTAGQVSAFAYLNGAIQPIGSGFAFAVNDTGDVVGQSFLDSGGFVWHNGTTTPLGDFGFGHTQASDINSIGQVVGASRISLSVNRAFIWQNGSMTPLGSLGGQDSFASGINQSGQVAGTSDTLADPSDERLHAFRYVGGTMSDLGALTAGGSSSGNGINATGDVVGSSLDSAPGAAERAFLWTASNGMQPLGTLGGDYSRANAINDAQQIVGNSIDATGSTRAFLWSSGAMVSLDSLTDLPTGWHMIEANDINNQGWITGTALAPNLSAHAVLLTPEPSAAVSLALVGAVIARRRGRS